jgi:hypothetical protein
MQIHTSLGGGVGTQLRFHVKLGIGLGSENASTGPPTVLLTDIRLVLEAGTRLLLQYSTIQPKIQVPLPTRLMALTLARSPTNLNPASSAARCYHALDMI